MTSKLREAIRKIVKEESINEDPHRRVPALTGEPSVGVDVPFASVQRELKEPINHCESAMAQIEDLLSLFHSASETADELDEIRIDLKAVIDRLDIIRQG